MFYTDDGQKCALVYNIQKYTIHDGPGIRTEIFFKGCPMHCKWCSNPESIDPLQRLGVYPSKCLGQAKCNYCVKACPKEGKPIVFDGEGVLKSVSMEPDCRGCLLCAKRCPSRAVMVWGDKMTLPQLMKTIEEDRSFYQRSGGGVTLNGGEVMMQWEFAAELLEACHRASINTCVESSLQCPQEHMERVLEHTDILITDIKHMDSEKHREFTGMGNERILSNIKRAAELGTRMVIRTPIVPDHNNDVENMRKTGEFIRGLGSAVIQYQLLPYRKMGTEKYATLCQDYPMGDFVPPERPVWEKNLLELQTMLTEEYGIPAVAGSSHKLPL